MPSPPLPLQASAATFSSGIQVSNITYFANAQTNLVPWQPLQFFTIVADRMLREYSTAWFQSDPTNYLITYYGITPNLSGCCQCGSA